MAWKDKERKRRVQGKAAEEEKTPARQRERKQNVTAVREKMRSQESFLNKLRHVSPTPPLNAVYIGIAMHFSVQVCGDQSQGAVFLREFTLIRRESLHEDFLSDFLNNHKTEDP
ncbi:hypothetical protein STEG23_011215, partial [Scotinomys teguina]